LIDQGVPADRRVGLYVLLGPVIASYFPFFALFLSSRRLTPSDVGVVVAVMASARIGANPVWGHLADATLGRRTAIVAGLFGSSLAALLLLAVGHGIAGVLAPAILLAVWSGSIHPNIDAWTLAGLGSEGMSGYGRIRAWESLSYAACCIAFGALLQAVGATWLMAVHATSLFILALWVLTIPRDRPVEGERVRHGRLGTAGAVLRGSVRFRWYLFASLLLWIGFNGAWNFLALRIQRQGGGPLLVGLGTALGGVVEVAVMLASPRLTARYGLRAVYVAGSVVYATAFVLWGVVSSPVAVSLFTMFEGLGFALLYTSGVVIVGRLVPVSLYATGQSLAVTVSFGIAPIVGGAVGGLVFEQLGAAVLYVGAAVLALTGGAVVWRTLPGSEFRRPAPEAAVA
jgi:PPP family 3-phenylpropionic acid transporter